MKWLIIIFAIVISPIVLFAQETVTFEASDGLKITASLYEVKADNPYILFFHQAGSSRGEYKQSARKFLNLGYNCLAVDLRFGDEIEYVSNETAAEAKRTGKPSTINDAEKDILAAIEYAWGKSPKQMVILGSSYSASLCLKVAKGNDKVKAVIAFSPGEVLKPYYDLRENLKDFDKPVLAACAQRELTYMEDMFSNVSSDMKKLFSPKNGPGDHGSKCLWKECAESREYWWELNLFFKKFQ